MNSAVLQGTVMPREKRLARSATSRGRSAETLPSPIYGSIVTHLHEIGQDSISLQDFIVNFWGSVFTNCFMTWIFGAFGIITVAMCYFGLLYINKCPAMHKIPIYLLVGGSVGLLQIILIMMRHRREHQEDMGEDTDLTAMGIRSQGQLHSFSNRSSKLTEGFFWAFLFIWFIAGNVWVLSVFRPPARQHERSPNPTYWCDAYMYNFALLQIGLTHVVIILVSSIILILLLCARRFMGPEPNDGHR